MLALFLGHQITVLNHGYPAETAQDGLLRWSGDSGADLVILMYGNNDADPRGKRIPVPLDAYQATMERLIRRRMKEGAGVIVLAPPPAGIATAEAAIKPYRAAARRAAQTTGAAFVDPASLLSEVTAPIQLDGIHLRSPAYRAIARGLERMLTAQYLRDDDDHPFGEKYTVR